MANAVPYIVSLLVATFGFVLVLRILAPWAQRVLISMIASSSFGLAHGLSIALTFLLGLAQAYVCVVVFHAFGRPPATLMLWILGVLAWLPPSGMSIPWVTGLLVGGYAWYS